MRPWPYHRGLPFISWGFLAILLTTADLQALDSPPISGSEEAVKAYDGEMKGSSNSHMIVIQMVDDLLYLTSEPDFIVVVGGLSVAPGLFGSAFRLESPEFTELWGPSPFADNLFEAGETLGDGKSVILISLSSWCLGKVAGHDRLTDFGSDMVRVQAINGLLTAVLKGAVNRARPDGAPYSYPSGHTSSAFAGAAIVHKHFGQVWGIPALIAAGYVGLSRLQEGKHYLSDVIAGGLLGSYVSIKLTQRREDRGTMSVAPSRIGETVGVSLSFSF